MARTQTPPLNLDPDPGLNATTELFYRGNYADLVASTVDAHPSVIPRGAAALIIGSLGYLGRVSEAKHLFEKSRSHLSQSDKVAAGYHLGVAYTRHSQYTEAVACFTRNLLLARKSNDPMIRFYGFMGVGFYRFFCARFALCIRAAEMAMLSSLDAEFTYGKYLTFELLGHAKVNVGLISEGIADIRQAERLASLFGNGSMVEAFCIARTCYEAQFGIEGSSVVGRLTRLYEETSPQNTHSRATLLLELSRYTALQGSLTIAQNYLNQASRIIYETRHRRYGAYLNFRYAYHAYLNGRFEESLNMLRAAEGSIHKGVDRFLLLKILDLEQRLRKQIGLTGVQDSVIDRTIVDLTLRIGNSVATRVLDRRSVQGFQRTSPGEDVIGDLLDSRDHESSVPSLLAQGYLTPLRELLKIPLGKRLIILNVGNDCSLIVDRGDIRAMSGLSKQLQRLLVVLSAGEISKEKLVASVWGYHKYDQLRHDGNLFQAMARLRHLLGDQKDWVRNTERGYLLQEGVTVKDQSLTAPRRAASDEPQTSEKDNPVTSSVGHPRLEQAKLRLKKQGFTTKDYMEAVNVSKATACRDLSEFTMSNTLKKLGKGRVIKYIFV